MKSQIILGDCFEALQTLPDASCDSVVTDPPYGLGTREPTAEEIVAYLLGARLDTGGDFMSRQWDVPSVAVWKECFRVLKPGGHLLSFGGTRTFDLISVGIRAAGFECRDTVASQFSVMCMQWIQGQGFPKSLSITKALEKMGLTADEVAKWEGWGSALKPSWEPILVFRKPVAESTVAKQVLKTGTGAMNIDACRVGTTKEIPGGGPRRAAQGSAYGDLSNDPATGTGWNPNVGRWPANLLLTHAPGCKLVGTAKVKAPVINRFDDGAKPFGDGAGHAYTSTKTGDADGNEAVSVYDCEDGCPVDALDTQSGERGVSGSARKGVPNPAPTAKGFMRMAGPEGPSPYVPINTYPNDVGGASRYFSQFERDSPDIECEPGCPVKSLDDQSGRIPSHGGGPINQSASGAEASVSFYGSQGRTLVFKRILDDGGASRFFTQFTTNASEYDCEPGCPVKSLDDQAGLRKTSGGALNRSGIGFQGGSDGNETFIPPSEGTASRFFQNFTHECEDGCPVKALDDQSGHLKSPSPYTYAGKKSGGFTNGDIGQGIGHDREYGDEGGASRFFQNFDCEPGCPIAALDDQSGELRARGNIGDSKGGGGMYGHGLTTNSFGAGDAGGASRFFQNFDYDCADGCPIAALDQQSGNRVSKWGITKGGHAGEKSWWGLAAQPDALNKYAGEEGGASRFFQNFECVDGCPIKLLGDQSGTSTSLGGKNGGKFTGAVSYEGGFSGSNPGATAGGFGDTGTAARFYSQFTPEAPFFYATKASKSERDRGLPKGTNTHPTLKPIKLMRWLVKLVTPKGGVVLDPFCGSGTTCVAALEEGCGYVGIERDPEFHKIALMRTTREVAVDIFDDLADL